MHDARLVSNRAITWRYETWEGKDNQATELGACGKVISLGIMFNLLQLPSLAS